MSKAAAPPPACRPPPRLRLLRQRLRGRLPITGLLAISFGTLVLVAVGAVLAVSLLGASANTGALLRSRVDITLTAISWQIENHLRPVEAQVEYLAKLVADGRLDIQNREETNAVVLGALAATPQVRGMVVVRPDMTIVRLDRATGTSQEESWRQRIPLPASNMRSMIDQAKREGKPVWRPLFSPNLSESILSLYTPLFVGGSFAGVLISAVSVDDLHAFMGEMSGDLSMTAFILHGHDQVLAHPRIRGRQLGLSYDQPLPLLDVIGDPVLARLWDRDARPLTLTRDIPNTRGVRQVIQGVPYIYFTRELTRFGETPWVIGVYFEQELVGDELRRLRNMAFGGLAILVLAVLAAWGLGRMTGRPIVRLARAAGVLAEGDLDRVPRLGGSPIRELDQAAQTFNATVDNLRERLRLRDLFGRYLPPEVARQVLAASHTLELGGEKRDVSALFSDIAGFTTLSESRPPEQVVPALNTYLEEVCRIVDRHGGIVVDFIGDAVFALFGAPMNQPDHAARALACARAIDNFGRRYSQQKAAEGLPFGITRLGLHSGVATVGNFGSLDRLKFSASGDVINTASRLEGANKVFGTRLLASAQVVERGEDHHHRPVGELVLAGRSQALAVFEVLGADFPPDRLTAYRRAYDLLAEGEADALAAFQTLDQQWPGDGVVRHHLDRLERGERGAVVTLASK